MTTNLKIIRLRDVISIKPEGEFDFKQVEKVLRKIAVVPGAFTTYDILIDTRGAEVHLSFVQVYEVAKELSKLVHGSSPKGYVAKIAILCPYSGFEYAKFLELCSQNRGLNIQAFMEFEKMYEWISETSSLV